MRLAPVRGYVSECVVHMTSPITLVQLVGTRIKDNLRKRRFLLRVSAKEEASVIDPAPACCVSNACLSATGRTRVHRGGLSPALHLYAPTSLARPVPRPATSHAPQPVPLLP